VEHALPWLLIAGVPVVFAVTTWNYLPQSNASFAAVRLFGVPVLVIEFCVIIMSLRFGWRPVEQFRSLSVVTSALVGAIVVLAFATAILAAPRRQAAIVWTDISLLHLIFGFAVAHLAREATDFERRLFWPATVVGISLFAIMLMAFASAPHGETFDWRYLGFGVSNVRQLGFYSAIGTAAAIGLGVQGRGLQQSLFVLAGGVCLSIAIWSGTRGTLVAVPLALVLLLITFPIVRSFRTLFVVSTTSAIAILVAMQQSSPNSLYGFRRLATSVAAPNINDLSSNRMAIWHDAWSSFLERPLFGFGEAQLTFIRPEIKGEFLHPHNFVLQLLLQWGVTGTALFAALVLIGVRACRSPVTDNAKLTIPAALVAFTLAAYSIFDGALFHTYPVAMFTVSAAILISNGTGRRATNR
jgi:O-antigen ligase